MWQRQLAVVSGCSRTPQPEREHTRFPAAYPEPTSMADGYSTLEMYRAEAMAELPTYSASPTD